MRSILAALAAVALVTMLTGCTSAPPAAATRPELPVAKTPTPAKVQPTALVPVKPMKVAKATLAKPTVPAKKPAPIAIPLAKKPPPTATTTTPAPKPLGNVDAASWPLPAASKPEAWQSVWHNPGTVTAEGKGIKVQCKSGTNDKTTVAFDIKADLRGRTGFVVNVNNPSAGPVGLAIALLTSKGGKYYESPMTTVNPGPNREVAFDLTASNFKKAPKWLPDSRVEGSDSTAKLCLVIYTKQDVALTFDTFALVKE